MSEPLYRVPGCSRQLLVTSLLATVCAGFSFSSTLPAQALDQSDSPAITNNQDPAEPQAPKLRPSSQETAPPDGLAVGTSDDPVIATVAREQIRLSDLQFTAGQFPTDEQIAVALRREIQARVVYLEALKAGFDLNPNVVRELARTRRSLVSSALLEREAARLTSSPTEEQISAFIVSKPEFFGSRRVYRFTEVIAQFSQPEDLARVIAQVNSYDPGPKTQYGNADDFVGWLKAQGLTFLGRVTASRGAEELDAQSYEVLKSMDKTSYAVVPSENKLQARVLFLHSNVPEPVNPQVYRDNVRLGLLAKARTEALEKHLNDLVSKADVKIDDETLAATVEELGRRVSAATPSETRPGAVITKRLKVEVFWLLFATVIASFVAMRMAVLARQLWSDGDRTRTLAIGLPLLTAALVMGSGWALFIWAHQGSLQKLFDVTLVPSLVGGLVGGLFVIALSYLISITDRPYLKSALVLGSLGVCHAALLGGSLMGW